MLLGFLSYADEANPHRSLVLLTKRHTTLGVE
jgi:hypothetical protein